MPIDDSDDDNDGTPDSHDTDDDGDGVPDEDDEDRDTDGDGTPDIGKLYKKTRPNCEQDRIKVVYKVDLHLALQSFFFFFALFCTCKYKKVQCAFFILQEVNFETLPWYSMVRCTLPIVNMHELSFYSSLLLNQFFIQYFLVLINRFRCFYLRNVF